MQRGGSGQDLTIATLTRCWSNPSRAQCGELGMVAVEKFIGRTGGKRIRKREKQKSGMFVR